MQTTAWYIRKKGSVQNLQWGDISVPDAKGVKIAVKGAALNSADQKVLSGMFVGKILHASRFPIRLGYDFSGTTASGDDVFGFLPYSASNQQGTFASSIFAQEGEFAKKPSNLSHADAASLPTCALTALQALRDQAQIKTGYRVLINGASGGVGCLAVQIAKILGANVTAVASAEKASFVKALGADEVIDYRTKKLSGIKSRFDMVFDVVSNSSFSVCQKLLNRRGVYVTLLPSPGLLLGFLQSLGSAKKVRFVAVKARRADLELIAQWVEAGRLKPVVERCFPLKSLPDAYELLASGKAKGKISISAEASNS